MKLGPIIHGSLLVVALFVAYLGWTRDDTKKPDVGETVVWDHPAESFEAMSYETELKTIRADRRKDGSADYMWVEHVAFKKPPKKKEGEADDAPAAAPIETRRREFPVGDKGEELVGHMSKLLALRELTGLDDEKKEEYGLKEANDLVTVSFKGGKQESLQIGSRVYGGTDRYVLHVESGRAFVLSKAVFKNIESGESVLKLKKLHSYENDAPAKIVLAAGGKSKNLVKTETEDDKGKHSGWAYAESPETTDQTLKNFLDRAEKLSPAEYESDVEGAEKVVAIEYSDASGKKLGFFEFYRKVPAELSGDEGEEGDSKNEATAADDDSAKDGETADEPDAAKADTPPEIEYFVRTERTHSFAKVPRLAAERVDQDIAELFELPTPPVTPVPKKKARPPMPPGAPAPGAPAHGVPGHAPGAVPGKPGPAGVPRIPGKTVPASKGAASKAPAPPPAATPPKPAKPTPAPAPKKPATP